MNEWQKRIKLLIDKGKTQHEIAEFCEVSDSAIHKLRTQNRIPSLPVGKKITYLCELLGVDYVA